MKSMNEKKPDEQRDLFIPAIIVFSVIYLLQTWFVAYFLIDWRRLNSGIFFFGFELIFIGIAYDITEALFAIFAQPKRTPSLISLLEYPRVALLMTVCDDSNSSRWSTLVQSYPNYDVFILDDSKNPAEQALVDKSDQIVVRRPEKHAFKAGNLNHWLGKYGNAYKYFVILDSDSLISNDFVKEMVSFAEHPANGRIAVFQSYIYPIDAKTIFSRVLGSMTRFRFYVADRFANRTGLVLSWGHNQMIRTDAVRQVGGFCESITPEDTSISLGLSQIGYSVRLVNVTSYDTDPQDIFSFIRRIARWAGQTAEVFTLPWSGASFRLKLLLCYHLYSYTIHNIYLVLLIYTAWGFDARGISPMKLFEFIGNNIQELWLWTLVLVEMSVLWLVQFLLRVYLGRRAGISMKEFFRHTFLATALHSFSGFSVNVSVIRGLIGRKMNFTPTNARTPSSSEMNLPYFARDALFWLLTGGLILSGMSLRNTLLFFGLNGIWIFFWMVSPLTLFVFHRDQFA